MLFNEPKLLKSDDVAVRFLGTNRFSALQRAEIAEIWIAHPFWRSRLSFSALQRAEIAEIPAEVQSALAVIFVSVLFNEPKLLKCVHRRR